MMLQRAAILLFGATTAVVTLAASQSSVQTRPWPPNVQTASEHSPPLAPDDALAAFHMPPGYRVELVASEPLVQEPVAMDWDPEGRLWVVEMPGFMADLTGSNELEPIGRVAVLQDTNGDGRMDKRTVFAEKLVLARSIKVLSHGVLVAEPPHVWLMRDTDGDLRMDAKDEVTNAYGRRDADPQNNANGFDWSLDNRMYTAGMADIHLRLQDLKIETHRTLQRGEWGVTHDDAGRVYRNTNESALHVDAVPTAYYARHPNLLRTRGSYDRLADGSPDLNVVWPVRPNPGTNRAYQAGIDRPDGTLARFTSVCAPVVYRGDRLPPDLYGNVFVAEPAANVVSRIVLEDGASGLKARKAYERGEFLASTDERFRPVFISNAPDGTLYVADLYRGIIEHRISITEYLRDQILSRKLDQGTGYGRIYRVVHESTRRDAARMTAAPSAAQLVDRLSHPNGWWRDTAHRLLVERGERTAVPALVKLAAGARDWRTRLHALWILDGLEAIEPALVAKALEDRSREVRVSAVRIAERWLGRADHPVGAAVLRRLDDSDPWVRQQLAASLGALPPGARESAVSRLLERHATDPIVMDAALSGLRGHEADVLALLLPPDAPATIDRETAAAMLAATIVRGAQDDAVQKLLAAIGGKDRAGWQRSALLRGVEIALTGAPMPGSRTSNPARPATSANLPCPTCPGGRAGPGGAYAFPRPAFWQAGRANAAGPRLRLTAAPAPLVALAADNSDLGKRATTVLTRISWPGKPGDEASVAPLTADQQARFDAGREIYRNVCQGCHQPDGRGQEKLAPSLVGSAFLLADAGIPVRILIHGKEGSIGLMPPIGGTFDDEQVAGILTYVRREWGNAGSAVDAATVQAVRAATASRSRPWKEAELVDLIEK